jgi:hypothetical protein
MNNRPVGGRSSEMQSHPIKINLSCVSSWCIKVFCYLSTDEQLILFLHCCQQRLTECKQVIEAYYTIRSNSPELFEDRDPEGHDVQQALSIL